MVTTTSHSQIVERVQELVRAHYVDESTADAIAADLGSVGDLGGLDAAGLASALTARLREVSGDGHLRVRHCAGGVLPEGDSDAYELRYATEAAGNAGGVRRVIRLDERTALLEVAPYLSPVHMAAPFVDSAFRLLAGARHLVVDVRAGHGGLPETVALVCGHLLGHEPVHLQDMVARGGRVRQFWTSPSPHRLAGDVRIDVLTSSETFSGCEELAYNLQALQRATVFGEVTGGGAHPRETFRLDDVLEAHIPVAAPVNAVTGGNWEQVGVVPDVPCPAGQALERALDHPGLGVRAASGGGG